MPLPLYQRNQTARAVAGAVAATREVERDAAEARVRGEILAAWARCEAAADAFRALEGARAAVEQSERLATRGYELGQSDLTSVVVVRRTTAEARVAFAEALLAWVRARAALDAAAGVEP
jgi:cobalt-zinc-cadmium efflux system outer membrane protein